MLVYSLSPWKDMEPGEPIFDVPRSCTIYPELVFADRGLGGSMQKLASASGTGVEVVALATFLAKEKLKGSESTFRPYIECLPWDATHPLMWTDDEVDLLKGTYAYDEILGFRDQVQTPRPRLTQGMPTPWASDRFCASIRDMASSS